MKKHILLISIITLVFSLYSYTQDFQIDRTLVEYDGHKLSVSYDLNTRSQSDIFLVIIEILKDDGTPVKAESFKGDIGENIRPGINKNIEWIPEDDAIFLDDSVTVEIKAERYEREFNRGSVIVKSAIMPGLGQAKISSGKPWWLAGIAAYGSLAGGLIFNSNYQKNYDAYTLETDPLERADLFDQSQKDKQLSSILFVSAAAIWVGNLIWVAAAPNEYRPRKLSEFSVRASAMPGNKGVITGLTITLDF